MDLFENIDLALADWKREIEVKEFLIVLKEINLKLQELETVEKNEIAHNSVVEVLYRYLHDFLCVCTQRRNFKPKLRDSIIILASKLRTISQVLDYAYRMPLDDLCWVDKTHPRWEGIMKKLTFIQPKDVNKIRASYSKFLDKVVMGQASVSAAFEESEVEKRNFMLGLNTIYYFFFKSKAIEQTSLFYANPSSEVAIASWNLLDSWLLSNSISVLLPLIDQNQMIYVPRTSPHFSMRSSFIDESNEYSLKPSEHYVPIRILSNYKFKCFEKKNWDFTCWGLREIKKNHARGIIFHIHGGGFISMSSKSHQNYTRKWAIDLETPVFSVDYRLAPKNPYPDGLDDIWQAYTWVLKNYKMLGIKLKKIIVTGDSAGGNLALALTYKAILSGVRVPDGLLLSYPAISLDMNYFTKSLLNSLEDKLLPHTILKMCLKSYLKDSNLDPSTEMFISPILVTSDIIARLPRLRFLLCEDDPLVDDNFRFIEKLISCGADVNCEVFRGTPHGALSFYMPMGVKESKFFYESSLKYFKELLHFKHH
jgi:hormone-sensitive lipase